MKNRHLFWNRWASATRLVTSLAMLTLSGLAAHALPVLTVPSSVTINESQSTQVSIGVTDAAKPIFTVTTKATSSNTNLVSNASLTFSGGGTNRLLSIRPGSMKSGTATITVVASDSVPSHATNSFTLTVNYSNFPPVFLTAIPVQTENENAGSNSFSFGISDTQFAASSLVVTASSTNTTLLPNTNLLVTGTGARRAVTWTPAHNQNGTSLIQVVVSNTAGGTATNNVILNVRPVTQPPTFTMSTNRIVYGENLGLVTISNFVTNVTSGPTNQSSESNYFVLHYLTNFFAQAPNLDTNYTLTFEVATNVFGTNSITFILYNTGPTTNGGINSTSNVLTLDTPHVNVAPNFTISTNLLLVNEETLAVTNANFLTGLNAGPTNQLGETWSFTATTITNNSTNASFTMLPFIGTAGKLSFHPAAHSFGTNQVTVVMTSSGSPANGGVNSATNTFLIGIAATNHAPGILGATNQTIFENAAPATVSITVWDYDLGTNLSLVANSLNTNVATASVTATNSVGASNIVFTVSLVSATNASGSATIQLIAAEGSLSTTNTFPVTVTLVTQPPNFTISNNMLLVTEETLVVTNTNFLTGLNAGPTNQLGETWSFTATTITNNSTNASFTMLPVIGTNGTVSFHPAAHSFGTNQVTVVMTSSGSPANGGVNSATNTFLIGIAATNHAPGILGATNQTIFENAAPATVSITVWDYDLGTNLSLVANSLNTNVATASVTATNSVGASNIVFTVSLVSATNASGSATIQLIAAEGSLSTTNTFPVTVTLVTQPPNFTISNNMLLVTEETLAVTNTNFLTGLNAGPTNQLGETWSFTATTITNNSTNASFTMLPVIGTNGTVSFHPAAHSFGTNQVTVVMTSSGSPANGGVNSATNTFLIGIAATNHAPGILGATNQTVFENAAPATVSITVWDYDLGTNLSLVANSLNTNVATASVTATNSVGASNIVFTVSLVSATNSSGSATIQLIAAEGSLSTTNTFPVTVTLVTQPPNFTISSGTNAWQVAENAGVTNVPGFLTNLNAGPTNQLGETWSFSVVCPTNNGTNATFATFPTVSTNGALSFKTATNSFGTNAVTIIMTSSGSPANGGINTSSNTFELQVTQVQYPPAFSGITNKTLWENQTTNLTLAFTLYDPLTTNFNVTCVSSNTNLVNVTITNLGTAQTLIFAPVTNMSGTTGISITANDGTLTNSTNLTLTINWVNQAPSFSLAMTNITVDEYNVATSIPNLVTNILAGPTNNESGQTVNFTITTNSNPGLFVIPPSLNSSGTLAFTPGAIAGTTTVGIKAVDNGGTANGGVNKSAVQTFTITVPDNAFAYLTGTFTGLFYDTNANAAANESSGYFTLDLSTNGTFTGNFLNAGTSNNFSGQFEISNGYANVSITNYILSLTVDTTASWTESVYGTISNTASGWNAELLSYLPGYSSDFPTALAGVYLMAMPGFSDPTAGPAGYSLFSLDLNTNGDATLTAFMADNTTAGQSSQISVDGYYPLYLPLYGHGSNGSVIGWLDVTGDLTNSVADTSTLTWFNEAGATTLYPAGFTNQALPLAALYDTNIDYLLSFSSGTVILSGGNLTTPMTNVVTISANQFYVDSGATNDLSLTINWATGEIQGSFVTPDNVTNSIDSVILQNSTNVVDGYFLGTSEGGSFTLYGN